MKRMLVDARVPKPKPEKPLSAATSLGYSVVPMQGLKEKEQVK